MKTKIVLMGTSKNRLHSSWSQWVFRGALMGLFSLLLIGCAEEKALDQPAAPEPVEMQTEATAIDAPALYKQNCMACHMRNGSGVPGMQPSLLDSQMLFEEEPSAAIKVVLQGSAALPQSDYSNQMAAYAHLSDAEIAALLNYIRQDILGQKHLPAVTAEMVNALR